MALNLSALSINSVGWSNKNSVPVGTIQSFGGGQVPSGWLLCDGSAVSRTTYPSLFAAIGTAHGAGDGVTTFHLPDLRGRFLRGADDMGTGAAGRDTDAASRTAGNAGGNTGNTVGSVQADSTRQHSHPLYSRDIAIPGNGPNRFISNSVGSLNETTQNSTGGETRPQNLAVEYIIRF